MKRFIWVAAILLTGVLMAAPHGGRGDGRRGDGDRRDGDRRDVGRTPSMSRGHNRDQSKPSRPAQQNKPKQDIKRPSINPASQGGKNPSIIYRPQQYNKNQSVQRRKDNRNYANRVNQIQRGRNWKNQNWWRRDRRWNDYGYWGSAPYWGYVSDWLPYGWSYPVYYDQGDVAVQITNYSSQYDEPDDQPAPEHPAIGDWLPLGIFVVGKSVDQAAYSTLYIQLAVNKVGEINGTYYNSGTDRSENLVGVVDAKTQQVAFRLSERENSPLIVTGIYNLMQDVTTVTAYFDSGLTQDWVLVRMQE
jgi:hypothetical protein